MGLVFSKVKRGRNAECFILECKDKNGKLFYIKTDKDKCCSEGNRVEVLYNPFLPEEGRVNVDGEINMEHKSSLEFIIFGLLILFIVVYVYVSKKECW